MLRPWHIVVDELESKDEAEVGQKKTDGAKGWNLDPESSSGWGQLNIGYLADYGGDGCHGFREDIPRSRRLGSVGSCSTESRRTLAFPSAPGHRAIGAPQSESCSLDDVEDGRNANDHDDTIPKVSCKRIPGDLQFAVIENLA